MEQAKIDRINALAAKAKTPQGLTSAELEERAALRQEYVQAYRANLVAQLENTYIQYPDGTRKKLRGGQGEPSGAPAQGDGDGYD